MNAQCNPSDRAQRDGVEAWVGSRQLVCFWHLMTALCPSGISALTWRYRCSLSPGDCGTEQWGCWTLGVYFVQDTL